MAMTVELRAELIGLFTEVIDADEHSIDLQGASHAVGGCSRLQSVIAGRQAALAPVLRRLELQAAQTRPTDDETTDAAESSADGSPADGTDGSDASGSDGRLPLDGPREPVVPRLSVREQRRRDRRSKWLDLFQGFFAALAAGRISTDHADALADVCERLEPWVVAELHGMEAHLLSYARTLGPEALTTELTNRVEAIRDDRGQSTYQHQLAESRAWLRFDRATGMYQLHAYLDPIRGEALQSVVDQYIDRLRRDPTYQQLPHEKVVLQALVDLVIHDIRIMPKVLAVVDEQSARTGLQHGFTVCENIDGARLPLDHVLAACAINGNVTAAIIDRAGKPADLHTTDRCGDDAQRLDLRGMDRECVFPGCDAPFSRLHMHHVLFHHDDGKTVVSNLVPACNGHHHDIHDRGWGLAIDAQRTITITRPDGTVHAVVPATRLDRQPTTTGTTAESPPGRPPDGSLTSATRPARHDRDPGPPGETAPPAGTGPPATHPQRSAA